MSDDVLKFGDFQDPEAGDDLVRCARCGKRIPGTSTRCRACGVHFQGEAQDFYHPSEEGRRRTRRAPWFAVVALLLAIALIIGALGLR